MDVCRPGRGCCRTLAGEKAEPAATAVGTTVPLPEPIADQVAKSKGTDWNNYEVSHGRDATQATL